MASWVLTQGMCSLLPDPSLSLAFRPGLGAQESLIFPTYKTGMSMVTLIKAASVLPFCPCRKLVGWAPLLPHSTDEETGSERRGQKARRQSQDLDPGYLTLQPVFLMSVKGRG